MIKSPVLLFKSNFRVYRASDTGICLHCPLPECCGSDLGTVHIRKLRLAPTCPRDYAVYLGVDLGTAEALAGQTLARLGRSARGRNKDFRSVVRQAADRRRQLEEMKGNGRCQK